MDNSHGRGGRWDRRGFLRAVAAVGAAGAWVPSRNVFAAAEPSSLPPDLIQSAKKEGARGLLSSDRDARRRLQTESYAEEFYELGVR